MDPMTGYMIAQGTSTGMDFFDKGAGFFAPGWAGRRDVRREKARINQEKRLWDYQFDRTTAYNSPSAQMARLKAAGLNPNLVFGHGGAVSGNASGGGLSLPSSGRPPAARMADVSETMTALANIENTMADTKRINAQTGGVNEQGVPLDAPWYVKMFSGALTELGYSPVDIIRAVRDSPFIQKFIGSQTSPSPPPASLIFGGVPWTPPPPDPITKESKHNKFMKAYKWLFDGGKGFSHPEYF